MAQNVGAGEGMSAQHEETGSLVYADFAPRCMAMLIDLTLLGFLALFSLILLLSAAGALLIQSAPLGAIAATLFLFPLWLLLFCGFYFVVLHGSGGQTLGKIFMGIRVEDADGGVLGLGGAFLRLVGYLLSLFLFGAGFFWIAVDRRHLSWHDRLAGSRVVLV